MAAMINAMSLAAGRQLFDNETGIISVNKTEDKIISKSKLTPRLADKVP